jgi:hypothetical protein
MLDVSAGLAELDNAWLAANGDFFLVVTSAGGNLPFCEGI